MNEIILISLKRNVQKYRKEMLLTTPCDSTDHGVYLCKPAEQLGVPPPVWNDDCNR